MDGSVSSTASGFQAMTQDALTVLNRADSNQRAGCIDAAATTPTRIVRRETKPS